MADAAKKRAEILLMAEAQGKTLKPEHAKELEAYRSAGIIPKPEGKTRAMSDGAAKAYEGQIGIYAALKNSVGGFQDGYAGNTITGGLENTAQSLNSNIGTPGQREWWSNFRATDNMIRNDLFGAALTDTEKKAYEETTVSPNMDPAIVKENLARRAEIVRAALARKTEFLKKNKIDPDAVDALAGEYIQEFSPGYKPPPLADKGRLEFKDAPKEEAIGWRLPKDQEVALSSFAARAQSPDEIVTYAKGMGAQITPEGAKTAFDYYQKGGTEAAGVSYKNADEMAKAQARERLGAANTPVVAGAAGVGDSLTVGLRDKALAAGKTIFGGGTYADNLTNTRADSAVLTEDNPLSTLGGQVAGFIGGGAGVARAFPKAAQFMARGSRLAQAGKGIAADATYGAAYGANKAEDGEQVPGAIQGALEAGVGSAAGRGLATGLGRVFAPVGNKAVDLLRSKGVPVTPGQALGPAAARVEEKLQSVPVIGDMIGSARGKAEEGFNTAVLNDALKPLGVEIPAGKTGKAAMKFAQDAFNDAYGKARAGMQLVPDEELANALKDLSDRAANGEFTEETAKRLGKIYEAQVGRRIEKGVVSGDDYKAMHSKIGSLIDGAKRAQNDDLFSALNELQAIVDTTARKYSPPEAVSLMDAADEGYSLFVRAENAAKMRGGETGKFSASQYDSAVQRGDSSVRSKAYLRGEARGQDMAEAGKDILRNQVPDSGTVGRLALNTVALGGGGLASAYDPTGISPYVAGGLMLAYAPGSRQLLTKAISGKRPDELRKVGDALINNSKLAGAFGVPLALSGD